MPRTSRQTSTSKQKFSCNPPTLPEVSCSKQEEPKCTATQQNLEEILLANSYTPLSRICFETDGDYTCNYVEAKTEKGQRVIVHLDKEGTVDKDASKDCMYSMTSDGVIVPESVITSAEYCYKNELSGVAFYCDEGICVTKKARDFSTQTSKFVFKDASAKYSKVHDGHEIHFFVPVVGICSIESDPHRVQERINRVYDRILDNTRINCERRASNFEHCVHCLHSAAQAIDKKISSSWNSLEHSIAELEAIYCEYSKHSPSCTSEGYKSLLYNLRKRYELATDMASICHKFDSLAQEVNDTKQRLDTVHEKLGDFSNLEYRLD